MKKETNNDFGFISKGRGKKSNQKLKPYLVMQYLLKYTDENNVCTAKEISEYIQDTYYIAAERRSIYKDIEEINKAMLMVENEIDIDEAEKWLKDDEYDEEKFIVYNKHKKGFQVRRRFYDVYDIRLLAECVYSAKFLDKDQSERLANIVCDFVSEEQAESIRHEAFLTDRVKTNNKAVIENITTINEAMSRNDRHKPEKISFKYLKYSISDVKQQAERRQGEKYIVSPFALLINDGNYYLLAFEDKSQKMRTYRVDRMKKVDRIHEPRDGEKVFAEIDLKSYTQRVFSMYGGKQERVTMRFINPLLDTVIDRFGTNNIQYQKVDDTHFSVSAPVEVSNQFFGWLLGFGKKAKITYPEKVVTQFAEYLDNIRNMY